MNIGEKNEEVIFKAAIRLTSPGDRATYLQEACGSDTNLLTRLNALLQSHEDGADFLQRPPVVGTVDIDMPAFSDDSGASVGRYKLLERIGEGGMAVVYMAEQQEPIRRKVALKIIKLGMDTKQVIARFEAERQALAMMDHPNIAKVFDAGSTEAGRPYFVMELVTGVSITRYCDENRLGTKARLRLFMQVCAAVQHAHQKGIIHRDIKPANVMVTMHDGVPTPKVIDFGIAKATNQRLTEKTLFTRYAHIIGTPAYMSPEQADLSDIDVDTRSDIYSLGVLLYELLTGTPPFSEDQLRQAGYLEMHRVIREEEPTKPSIKLSMLGDTLTEVALHREATPDVLERLVRGDLDWIVMKSLEKDRTRRYDSTSQLLDDIQRHLRREPVSAGPPTAWYRVKKFVQRRQGLMTATAAVALAIVAGCLVSFVLYIQATRARQREATARADAQAVTTFLAGDLLASVYPEKTKGQEVTVRYILASASEHLEERLIGSPRARAKVHETLGQTYRKMGDYVTAEGHLQRALEVHRQHLGEEDPSTLTSMAQLGWLYWCQGCYEASAPLLDEAYHRRRRVLGPEHPDTLASMAQLAWVPTPKTSPSDRMRLAENAYETARRVLGQEHPSTLLAATTVAMKYVERFRHADAKAIAPSTYEACRRVLGEEHETTLVGMNALTWLYSQLRQYDVGAALGEEALETARRVVGEEHVITLHAMANLGTLYLGQGRDEDAVALLTRSVDLARANLGKDHLITLCCELKLAVLYRAQEQYDAHDPLVIDIMRTSLDRYGPEGVTTGFARSGLKVRKRQLTSQMERQSASGDQAGAAATRLRLEQIRRALDVNPGQPQEGSDQ